MRYADIYDCDISNGNSVGQSLFVQGCHFHCPKCFNAETWDFNGGKEWTSETEDGFIELAKRDYIKRISILGGEPLAPENVQDVSHLIKRIKKQFPEKQIWVYTGYTVEELQHAWDVLEYMDVLVDGRFEFDQKDLTLAFRGSRNQRILDAKKTWELGAPVLYDGQNR